MKVSESRTFLCREIVEGFRIRVEYIQEHVEELFFFFLEPRKLWVVFHEDSVKNFDLISREADVTSVHYVILHCRTALLPPFFFNVNSYQFILQLWP